MTTVLLLFLLAQYPPELPPLQPRMFVPTPRGAFLLNVPAQDFPAAPPGQPIKLLVLFPANTATSQADADAKCSQLIVNDNSVIAADILNPTRYQLVGCRYMVDYTSTTMSGDLNAMKAGTTLSANIVGWRDQSHADQVQMASVDGASCGLGYMDCWKYGKDWCMSVVNWGGCAISNLSAVHEKGHNEGLTHDEPNQTISQYFAYSAGWCNSALSQRDPMVYPSPCGGARQKRFGNPNLVINGVPWGDATHDGARILRQTMPIIANFYPPLIGSSPAAPGKPTIH